MAASADAKFAPIGALRGGLALTLLGGLMAWWEPLDTIPRWVWLATLFVGLLLVAVAMGIRMLRT